jgi:ribosomal-protein-alanine N-acetyltransferase
MVIRKVQVKDGAALREYYLANARHFREWEPRRENSFHTTESWNERATGMVLNQDQGNSAHFVAEIKGSIVAHCNLSNIVRGVFQACYMGYGVSLEYQGQGVAREICETAIHYAFNEMGLHRIMANYMPHNNRSAKLLKRLGFVREGLAKNYLQINGKWEDHVLTSLTNGAYT